MNYALWALAVLGCGAGVAVLSRRWPRVSLGSAIVAICVAGVLVLVAAVGVLAGTESGGAQLMTMWPLPLGAGAVERATTITLHLDGLSAWFLLATGLLAPCAAIYSWGYLGDRLRPVARAPRPCASPESMGGAPMPQAQSSSWGVATYGALLCLLVAAIVLVFVAADTVLFLVAWELMSVCGFFLILFQDRDAQTRRGAWVYLIATHLGTALCLLPMFALLMAQSHSGRFAAFSYAMQAAPASLGAVVFVLGLIGFGTKSGLMPMHVWLPHAHPVAPSPVSALLSGIVIKCGIYGLLRLLTWLPPLPLWCAVALLGVAMLTGIMGILYAMAQHQLKRLLAYSSVENIGIIGLGIGMGMLGQATGQPMLATLAYGGALLHVLNHALFKGLLFLSAGSVLHSTGTGRIDRLGGLAKRMPANAALFLVAAVSICALPPLNGFVGEWLIYRALFGGAVAQQGWSWAAVLGLAALALIGGLALACFAKAFTITFLGDARDRDLHVHPVSRAMLWGMAPLAAMCLAIGLLAGLVVPLLGEALLPLRADSDVLPSALEPLGSMGLVLAALPVLVVILLVLRQRLAKRQPSVGGVATWGCGHPYADPRVQYTASSFSWTLVHCFRHSLRPTVRLTPPAGYFPKGGELATQTLDAAETRAFAPLFGWIAWQAQRLWPLQHGRLQLYLIYIVLALLLVFVIEAVWAPFAGAPDASRSRPPLSSSESSVVTVHQGG